MKPTPIKILSIEDNPADVDFINELLTNGKHYPFDIIWAEQLSTGLAYFEAGHVDIILLDLSLPDSQGMSTFTRVHQQAPQIPIVVMSGLNDEELAIQAVHAGAQDYVVKGQIDGGSLRRTIRHAIERKRLENDREKLIADLQQALAEIKVLRGFIPICSSCKKVRDDQGYWQRIEIYISEHSEADFTHGICPDCTRLLYPELFDDDEFE
jgi:DNA-binding response OmpR family regulator